MRQAARRHGRNSGTVDVTYRPYPEPLFNHNGNNTPSEECCLKNIFYLCMSRQRRTYLMKVFSFYPYAEIW